MSWGDHEGFHQDFEPDPSGPQPLYVYCRECRRGFKVTVKATPGAKVRCICGHIDRLAKFDVFGDIEKAKDFARFYTRVVYDVKRALRDADLPVPESGRLPGQEDDPVVLLESEPPSVSEELRALTDIAGKSEDIVERHDALSQLISLTYRTHHLDRFSRQRCIDACREDIGLVPDLIKESKRRKKEGRPVRLSFTSFRHLSIILHEEGDIEEALAVARHAESLGLKGYEDRIAELMAEIDAPTTEFRASGEMNLS